MKPPRPLTVDRNPLARPLQRCGRYTTDEGHYRVAPAPRDGERDEDETPIPLDEWVGLDGER